MIGTSAIRNPGGYFRAYVRKIAAHEMDLVGEIGALRRRRAH